MANPPPSPWRRRDRVGLAAAAGITGCLLGLGGCGGRDEPDFNADSDGVPVTVSVTYREPVFAAMPQAFVRHDVLERYVVREPVYYHHGYAAYEYQEVTREAHPRTRAVLLAGDGPEDDELWSWPLEPGTQHATVPIRPGRQVTLTLVARGGYRGSAVLGTFTPDAMAGQQMSIVLDQDGAHVSPIGIRGVTPIAQPPGPPPAPSSAPPPASPPTPPPAPSPAPPPGAP